MKKYFNTIIRVALGLFLVKNSVIGTLTPLESLNLPPDIYHFIKSLWDTGFMMHLVKSIELMTGVSLILNLYVPLTLIAIFPIAINIYGLHIFVFNLILTNGLYMLIAISYLIFIERETYLPLIKMRGRSGYFS